MVNIVLVGFMGTGKTTIAKRLADRLNMRYVSTDELIEKREGMSIPEIFSKKGESYFRKVEKEVVKEVSDFNKAVIDAGGGVVIDPENVKNLKKNGVMVCLWTDPQTVLERTKHNTYRPLLNVEDQLERIRELMEQRRQFYERADFHINTQKMSIEEVICEIERIVNERNQ